MCRPRPVPPSRPPPASRPYSHGEPGRDAGRFTRTESGGALHPACRSSSSRAGSTTTSRDTREPAVEIVGVDDGHAIGGLAGCAERCDAGTQQGVVDAHGERIELAGGSPVRRLPIDVSNTAATGIDRIERGVGAVGAIEQTDGSRLASSRSASVIRSASHDSGLAVAIASECGRVSRRPRIDADAAGSGAGKCSTCVRAVACGRNRRQPSETASRAFRSSWTPRR